jgi:hypothetical protein
MPEPLDSPNSADALAIANYIASVSADLAQMARGSGLETVGYLLEMVRLEAENLTRDFE